MTMAAPADPLFASPALARNVTEWLETRANAADKARFQRVFGTLTSGTDAERLHAAGVAKQRASSARPSKPGDAGIGWSYVSTKAAKKAGVGTVHLNENGHLSLLSPQHATHPSTREEEYQPQLESWGSPIPANRGGGINGSHEREMRSLRIAQEHRASSRETGGTMSLLPNASQPAMERSPNVSTYQTSYNLRDYYPGPYNDAVAVGRAAPVTNYTFTSQYGDLMRRNAVDIATVAGEGGEGGTTPRSKPQTTYAQLNATVHRATTDFEVMKDAEFMKWLAKQKTYFRDLLAKGGDGEAGMEQMLAAAEGNPARQKELLLALRQVYAVAKPDLYRSVTHEMHCPMVKTEDPELVALVTTLARMKTMGVENSPQEIAARLEDSKTRADIAFHAAAGLPPPIPPAAHPQPLPRTSSGPCCSSRAADEVSTTPVVSESQPAPGRVLGQARTQSLGARPASAPMKTVALTFAGEATSWSGARGDGDGSGGGTGGGLPPRPSSAMMMLRSKGLGTKSKLREGPHAEKETFKSQAPIQWLLGSGMEPQQSAYQEHYGGNKVGAQRSGRKTQSARAIRFKEFTQPMGAVNPHTAILPVRSAFPVPASFLMERTWPRPDVAGMTTVYAQTFAPRGEADVLRTLKAAATLTEASRKALHESTLPLGKSGINMVSEKDWETGHHREFKATPLDVSDNYARAEAMHRIFNGPTASSGKVAPDVPAYLTFAAA